MGALFDRVLAGDTQATAELQAFLRSFARQVCRGGGPPGAPDIDWEDVAQECGRKLLAGGLERYTGAGSERSYIYSMVRATVLEMARASSRRRRREEASTSNGPVRSADPDAPLDVRSLLAGLDTPCREIIQRIVLRDEAYPSVARDLGLAESSVRAKLSRCLARARKIASKGKSP